MTQTVSTVGVFFLLGLTGGDEFFFSTTRWKHQRGGQRWAGGSIGCGCLWSIPLQHAAQMYGCVDMLPSNLDIAYEYMAALLTATLNEVEQSSWPKTQGIRHRAEPFQALT